MPARRASDALRGLARLAIGGEEILLPVLTIEQNEAWVSALDAELAGLVAGITGGPEAGTPAEDLELVLSALASELPRLVAALADYDRGGLLGGVDGIRRRARPHEVIAALLTIWRAANPLADIALLGLATSGTSSGPTSSPSAPGGSTTGPSAGPGPRSSGSTGSTPRSTGSSASTTSGSRRSAQPRSSRTTTGSTAHGAAARPPAGRRAGATP